MSSYITRIADAAKTLHSVDFSVIAVTGISGLVIGPVLAAAMEKDLLVIRKSLSGTHSDELVEGQGRNQRILLVDDMVAEGHTLRRMESDILDNCLNPEIVGAYLYSWDRFYARDGEWLSKLLTERDD